MYLGDDTSPGNTALEISQILTEELQEPVQERSVIAKLSSIQVYKKKIYRTKRGEVPIKKEEYIEKLAVLLNVDVEQLESLEKVNKSVLAKLTEALMMSASPTSAPSTEE